MARGQLQDALTHFHAALEKDPNNYLTLYRRATVYLAQGRARAALEDLNKVLEIQPDFIQARSQKGNILVKLGRLDEAYIELDKVVSIPPHQCSDITISNLDTFVISSRENLPMLKRVSTFLLSKA